MINEVWGCYFCEKKVDVVIICNFGSDVYNEVILVMDGVSLVKILIILDWEEVIRENVVEDIEDVEVIFFVGGD